MIKKLATRRGLAGAAIETLNTKPAVNDNDQLKRQILNTLGVNESELHEIVAEARRLKEDRDIIANYSAESIPAQPNILLTSSEKAFARRRERSVAAKLQRDQALARLQENQTNGTRCTPSLLKPAEKEL
jgi:hypothetical protein